MPGTALNNQISIWPLVIILLPHLVVSGELPPSPPRPVKVALIHLDGCCPDARWTEAEDELVKELTLQNIHVEGSSPSDAAAAWSDRYLADAAGIGGADGAVVVVRTGVGIAEVHFLVRDRESRATMSRKLTVEDTASPDAAVTTALRAVESLVASYDELLGKRPGPESGGLLHAVSAEPSSAQPTFGVMPKLDAFSTSELEIPETKVTRSAEREPRADAEAPVDETGPDEPAEGEGTPNLPPATTGSPPMGSEPARFTMDAGGAFIFSAGNAGVRSGFALGAGYRVLQGLILALDIRYLPFGPDVSGAGDRSSLDLLAIRGWACRRFLKGRVVRPAVMVGGGGLLVFAKGEGPSSETVALRSDTAEVGFVSLGADVHIAVGKRTAFIAGAALGFAVPEVTLRHRGALVATLGLPLIEWTMRVEVGIF